MIETRYFIKFHLVLSIQNDFKFMKYKKHRNIRAFCIALQSRIHDNKNKDKNKNSHPGLSTKYFYWKTIVVNFI